MSELLDLLGALALLVGAFLCLVTAIALVRFPDVLTKMHSITKPQVLGMLLIAAGTTLTLRTWWVVAVCTVMVAMQLLTSPVSATMLSRSAYRAGLVDKDGLVMDELADDLARAGYKLSAREVYVPTGPETDFSADDFRPKPEPRPEPDEEPEVETPPDDLSAHAETSEEAEAAEGEGPEHAEAGTADEDASHDEETEPVEAAETGEAVRGAAAAESPAPGPPPDADPSATDGTVDDDDDDEDEDDEAEDLIASDAEDLLASYEDDSEPGDRHP